MYSRTLRRYLVILLAAGWVITLFYLLPRYNKKACLLKSVPIAAEIKAPRDPSIKEAFSLLKNRKDNAALVIFEKALREQPDDLDALWGKAEVLRRARDYKRAEDALNNILKKYPVHLSSLISLSYIRYKDDKLDEAQQLVGLVLKSDSLDKENEALAYLMLGTINSRRSAKGWFFSKIKYGMQIECFLLRAKELAPDLPEAHLGLGTFYLLAPGIAGGNLNKAIEELEMAVKIAPNLATANARLAQGYKKKGDLEKYNFYIQRTRELDPQNEVLKEIRDGS